ncbi:hypothetical protein O3M35_000048 [Rhynocoris fuscipes]|uniref:Uncharacterized protein n=1 Tax=Rhynocoris fuscipes TaxID=488301 RepID=A0AAW1DQE4_9HEMI
MRNSFSSQAEPAIDEDTEPVMNVGYGDLTHCLEEDFLFRYPSDLEKGKPIKKEAPKDEDSCDRRLSSLMFVYTICFVIGVFGMYACSK